MLLLCIVWKYPSAHTLLGPMLLVMFYPVSVQFSVYIYYTNRFTEQEMIQRVQASFQATLNFGQLWAYEELWSAWGQYEIKRICLTNDYV